MLMRLDAVQHRVALSITRMLADNELPIEVGSIQVRHLNRVILREIHIKDEKGDTAVDIPQITAHLSPLHLLKGDIQVNTVTIKQPTIKLYKKEANSPLNIQFIIDKLAGGDNKNNNTTPNIRINQIQLYDGKFTYDVKESTTTKATFDPSHIKIDDIALNVSLKKLNSDTLSLYLRTLSCKERTGLSLKRLSARINANPARTDIKDLVISLPQTKIKADAISISHKKNSPIGINGEIYSKAIVPADFVAFSPILKRELPSVATNIGLKGNKEKMLCTIDLRGCDSSIQMSATGKITNTGKRKNKSIELQLNEGTITEKGTTHIQTILADSTGQLDILKKLGKIELKGKATIANETLHTNINILSESGNIKGYATIDKQSNYTGEFAAQDINLGKILQNNSTDCCDALITTNGNLSSNNPTGKINATLTSFDYKGYEYAPITLHGEWDNNNIMATTICNDKNATAHINIIINNSNEQNITLKARIDTLDLHHLNLIENGKGAISTTIEGNYRLCKEDKFALDTRVYNITLFTPEESHNLHNLHITDNNLSGTRYLIASSDIADINVAGHFNYTTLAKTFEEIARIHLPAIMPVGSYTQPTNEYSFKIDLKETTAVSQLFDLPVSIGERSTILGNCDDNRKYFYVKSELKDVVYNKQEYSKVDATIISNNDKLTFNADLINNAKTTKDKKREKHPATIINISSTASNNQIANQITWKEYTEENNKQITDTLPAKNRGSFEFNVALSKNASHGTDFITTIKPNTILYNGTKWELSPCTITGENNRYTINDLLLNSEKQSLHINGTIGKSEEDNLAINLGQIDLDAILKLVNFTAVRFGGKTTGSISLSRMLNTPQVSTTLKVKDFTFHEGYMGDLDFEGRWNEENKAIELQGDIYDIDNAHTIVKGIVSPANDTIHLHIAADRTRLAFLNSMLSGIISDVKANVTGDIYVTGPMGSINLLGKGSAKGTMRLVATNATYNLLGDTIRLTHNKMSFDRFKIADLKGHKGELTGSVNHDCLGDFTCNFNIEADNLLAYHSPYFDENPFYGTAYVTGDASLTADDRGIFLHADVSSDEGSSFVYDAGSMGSVTNSNFITFIDSRKHHHEDKKEKEAKNANSLLSRLNLEFMLDITQDMQLRVYTNVKTEDYIDLYGNGPITAIYDEKDGFSMKGNLALERGTYKFTMQDIFPKEFDIIKGSTLTFDGDPFEADLNFKTKYLVPSASLSDLDPNGKRHKSVKVNCLMNITGKLEAPQLDFDIELPDANEEQRELLASAVNTPEQKNMQFIYLMGIGKFYTYDYNRSENGTQSSSAMESLISNTISGQLNNMLSQIIDNKNWNISGNFSSSERGWNSMEIEGILEGRLLDNRLLINGNFGYRENPMANTNFVGDFEVQWLLDKNGNVSLKAYNKTNDRYFSESTLTTQGAGIILRHDFNEWRWWLRKNKKEKEQP